MIFWREKEKKNCASRFEAKKAAMAWRHNFTGTGYSSTMHCTILAFSVNKW
jgi:hypothetical protein